ncbi:MAG: hypothetical protein KGZ68_04400 [Dechloromonas sp.]|nr:hypothetical protein [Dechloromonas sp.]
MEEALLLRERGDDQGTLGVLILPDGGAALRVVELPDRDNRRQLSRIPAGRYQCVPVRSPRFGKVYGVVGVPGRSAILIHGGNFAGDVLKRFKTNSQGCLIVGSKFGQINGQKAVLVSQPALRQLHTRMGMQPFWLNVEDA